MYRLLIITERNQLRDMFAGMGRQQMTEFKAPHFRQDLEGTKECLANHRIDAFAIDSCPEAEKCRDYLRTELPDAPIFALCASGEEQGEILHELSRLLGRLNADDVNGQYDPHAVLNLQRARWIKHLLTGFIPKQDIQRHIDLYRFDCGSDMPCVLVRMSIPEDDDFLSDRWHYGADRLEIALRNFFGEERSGIRMHLAVASPEEVLVLCVPSDMKTVPDIRIVEGYVQETVSQIEHYLGLRMTLNEVTALRGIDEFSKNMEAH